MPAHAAALVKGLVAGDVLKPSGKRLPGAQQEALMSVRLLVEAVNPSLPINAACFKQPTGEGGRTASAAKAAITC